MSTLATYVAKPIHRKGRKHGLLAQWTDDARGKARESPPRPRSTPERRLAEMWSGVFHLVRPLQPEDFFILAPTPQTKTLVASAPPEESHSTYSHYLDAFGPVGGGLWLFAEARARDVSAEPKAYEHMWAHELSRLAPYFDISRALVRKVSTDVQILDPPASSDGEEDLIGRIKDVVARERAGESQAEFILAELATRSEPQWIYALIIASDQVAFHSTDQRKRLTSTLLRIIENRTDLASYPDIPIAAIRRFSSLAQAQDLVALLPLLAAGELAPFTQVALQAIRTFAAGADVATPEWAELRDQVATLAWKFLDPHWVNSAQNASLAVNALSTSILLRSVRTEELIDRLNDLGRPSLVRLVRSHIQAAGESADLQGGANVADFLAAALEKMNGS